MHAHGLPRGSERSSGCLRSKSRIVENTRARVRALGGGCVAPNPAVARTEDSRAEDQESQSFAGFEAFLSFRCLSVRHWRDSAGLASAYARENSLAFNLTGNCVTFR